MRQCLRCNSEIDSSKRKGTRFCTPKCKKAWWDENNREKRRELNSANTRKWRYGLSKDDYSNLLTSQNNKCCICLGDLSTACIDHDHVTGKIRGILCHHCNTGLGLFKDNPQILESAIVYLTSHG